MITSNVTVRGGGRITLDGQDATRVLRIDGPDDPAPNIAVTLERLVITGGHTTAKFDRGAGINADNAQLTLTNSTLRDSSTAGESGQGGGIFADDSSVTLTNSTLSGNSTAGAGSRRRDLRRLHPGDPDRQHTQWQQHGGHRLRQRRRDPCPFQPGDRDEQHGQRQQHHGRRGRRRRDQSLYNSPVTLTNSTLSGNSTVGGDRA